MEDRGHGEDVRWMCVVCGPSRAWFRHAWRCRDRRGRDVRGGACAVLSVARARGRCSLGVEASRVNPWGGSVDSHVAHPPQFVSQLRFSHLSYTTMNSPGSVVPSGPRMAGWSRRSIKSTPHGYIYAWTHPEFAPRGTSRLSGAGAGWRGGLVAWVG